MEKDMVKKTENEIKIKKEREREKWKKMQNN